MVTPDFERTLRTLHPEAYSWTLVCCRGDRDAAEDVLQETYLRVIDGRLRFNGHSSFKTWFFAVVRRASRDRSRKQAVRRALLGRWSSPAEPREPEAEARIERNERSRAIRELLQRLSARQRQVLELVFFHDLSLREAASVMDVTLGTAGRHYDRGKRLLLEHLREAGLEL